MRVSLDEATSRQIGSPSPSVTSSATSPVSVSLAHASTSGRERRTAGSASVPMLCRSSW